VDRYCSLLCHVIAILICACFHRAMRVRLAGESPRCRDLHRVLIEIMQCLPVQVQCGQRYVPSISLTLIIPIHFRHSVLFSVSLSSRIGKRHRGFLEKLNELYELTMERMYVFYPCQIFTRQFSLNSVPTTRAAPNPSCASFPFPQPRTRRSTCIAPDRFFLASFLRTLFYILS
jgi:hypothetical protein